MKAIVFLTSTFIIMIGFSAVSFAGETVAGVIDGDTIELENGAIIELAGIDAPELSPGKGFPEQPYADDARDYLEDLIDDLTVSLINYGENGCLVFAGGKHINLEMVRAGLAEAVRTHPGLNMSPLNEAQEAAESRKLKMWGQDVDEYVSPSAWRNLYKSK